MIDKAILSTLTSLNLSLSKNKGADPWRHTEFNPSQISDFNGLFQAILENVWSPIIWKNGRRLSENFLFSDFMALDFDKKTEWNIERTIKFCEFHQYSYVIAPTKSHQKPKSGEDPCDRFRLLIPWREPITCRLTYEQNMRRIMKIIPADKACADSARMFQPSIRIASFSEGKGLGWQPYKSPQARKNEYIGSGILPPWLTAMMNESPPAGERNKHCFRLAAKLAEFGWSEGQCIDAVVASPVDIPHKEKASAARSGYRAGRAGRKS